MILLENLGEKYVLKRDVSYVGAAAPAVNEWRRSCADYATLHLSSAKFSKSRFLRRESNQLRSLLANSVKLCSFFAKQRTDFGNQPYPQLGSLGGTGRRIVKVVPLFSSLSKVIVP
jgi:hypothetical protein